MRKKVTDEHRYSETIILTLQARDLDIKAKARFTGLGYDEIYQYCKEHHLKSVNLNFSKPSKRPYKIITITLGEKKMDLPRVMAWHFIGEVEGKAVHHIDGNHKNNDPSNLCILTHRLHITIHNPHYRSLYGN